MPPWQHAFRAGFVPQLSTESLRVLLEALAADDPALVQGATTDPPPMMACLDWPCTGACPIGYCGWRGSGLATVGAVEEFFAERCLEADRLLGKPAGCRHFLRWVDETPREEMVPALRTEVESVLLDRACAACVRLIVA